MLYLRLGWLVGHAGLIGAIGVILAAYIITGTTAMSVSSIASNVRVRPGGAFAIIAGALGLEAGGAIGIPLFIAQASSVALYLYAFTEGWAFLFPSHPPMLVASVAFLVVSFVAYRSAALAFKAQGVMVFVVLIAIASAIFGLGTAHTLHAPQMLPASGEFSLLEAFAIFFPASTGIMIGVGMSGNLSKPREAIPKGTLAAWGVTLGVYVAGAVWYASIASPQELMSQPTIAIDRAAVGFFVLIGLLVSTLMAALSSLVAAPRLLQAMAKQRVVPLAEWLDDPDQSENPRNALFVTMGIAALALMTGSLNAVAPIITSFFIITYLAINVVVLLEHRLRMISFRPTFHIAPYLPVMGVVSCGIAMVLASPRGGILEFILVIAIYGMLSGRKLETPWETVHSGIALALADWATQKATRLERSQRAWKPDLMVPVDSPDALHWTLPLIKAITKRTGTVKLVGVGPHEEIETSLEQGLTILDSAGVFGTKALIKDSNWNDGVRFAAALLKASAFPPNLLLVNGVGRDDKELKDLIRVCEEHDLGLVLQLGDTFSLDSQRGKGINVWLSDRSPEWNLSLRIANVDLPVLMGFLLSEATSAPMRLLTVIREPDQKDAARRFLRQLMDMGRLPSTTRSRVLEGAFLEQLKEAPKADVNVFGVSSNIDFKRLKIIQKQTKGICLFLMDSGHESAIA